MRRRVDALSQAHNPIEVAGLADAVGQVLGERPISVVVERTHFPGARPVQSVLCAELTDGQRRTVFAECCPVDPQSHAERARASLAKTRNGQKTALNATAVVAVDAAGLVLRRPGLDERLPGLRLLHDPAFARGAIQKILGQDCGPVTPELVAHRLGKRAVLRLRGADLDVFVRLRSIKNGDGDARIKRHRALWQILSDDMPLRIPEPVGALPDIGASFFSVLPGEPADFAGTDVKAVAHAITALQALTPSGLTIHSGVDEARILWQWLERCQDKRPELARRVTPGLTRLKAKLAKASCTPCPCHRDLHEKQILVADGVAGMLDFDTLCLSDPALDIGNLLAHLFFAGQDEAPLRQQIDLPGIVVWRSAALYRLAMIYAFSSTPNANLDRLIEEADANVGD